MGRAEGVVFGLGAFGEAAEAVLLAERADAGAAAGQDLVGVALVAHVPNELVVGRVEGGVDCDGEFDNAEGRAKMAAGFRHGRDGFGAEFIGALGEFIVGQPPQIGRIGNAVENRGFGAVHGSFSVSVGLFRP